MNYLGLLTTPPPHNTTPVYLWRPDLPSPASRQPPASHPSSATPTLPLPKPPQSTPPHLTYYVGFSMCF
ncbi:hypothetical protein E2C01_088238 [Portunus trituberculatus]|uniref:Uncharacterized protein n=1 Tax=Portunus trituberculatus TaxID=210409 RepID=A0A5B7JG39_PORTR|nr:hypothetical protein [Portunus trituberculatus]